MVQGISRSTTSEICNIGNQTNVASSWKTVQDPLVTANNPYNQEIGQVWLEQAEGEHASVASFARHTLQLMSIGAPSELLVASQKASLDEIKHAKMCYGLASSFLGSDFGPGSLDVNESLERMSVKEIIRSVIQEGCIGETLAAIEARAKTNNAKDTAVKAVLSKISTDETRHAQLAWDTIKWIIDRYPDTRTFVEKTFHFELERHARKDDSQVNVAPCMDSEKDMYLRKYGVLVKEDRDKLREIGIRNIISPVYQSGFKDVSLISKQILKLNVA